MFSRKKERKKERKETLCLKTAVKRRIHRILAVSVVLIFSLVIAAACSDIATDGESRLKISMSSSTAARNTETAVDALNITVVRIDIIRSSDNALITLLDEPRDMDVLAIAANDPVVFSDVSVEPGQYEQLRLVLDDNSTIIVDGVEHPVKVPSGEQTGIKLSGTFSVPPGKLFEINLNFDVDKSVHYAPGQGYMLKPVIEVIGSGNIIGVFRGVLSLVGIIGEAETVIELRDTNNFRLKISEYPDYTITGNYVYNSVLKTVRLSNLSLDTPGMSAIVRNRLEREFPDEIYLPVKEWSLDSMIVLDIAGEARVLGLVDTFAFSGTYTYTDLTITVTYPDSSKDGKDVVVNLEPLSGQRKVNPVFSVFDGNTAIVRCSFSDKAAFISGDSVEYEVVGFIFDDIDKDILFEFRVVDGKTVLLMWPAWYLEHSHMPGLPEDNIATLTKGESNVFYLNFP